MDIIDLLYKGSWVQMGSKWVHLTPNKMGSQHPLFIGVVKLVNPDPKV